VTLSLADIDAARECLVQRGIEVREVFHLNPACPGTRPVGSLLPGLSLIQRPTGQRLAATGDQAASPAPEVGGLTSRGRCMTRKLWPVR
jgi:hypothetical protein